MKIKLLLGSLLIALAYSAASSAASLQHAEFAFDGKAIAQQLKAQGVQPKTETTVYCQAVVSAIGATEEALCFNKEGHDALSDLVAAAVLEQDFWPAHVNGRAIAVRTNFRVVLNSDQGQLVATVLPNLGVLQAQLGPHYVEPQERLDSASWYQYVTERRGEKSEPFFAHGGGMVRVAATVQTNGVADDVNVVEADRSYRSEAKTLRSGVRQSKFIPGYVNGQPVEMPYLAVMSFEK